MTGMILGFIIGCGIGFAAWGTIVFITGASRRKENERKEGIISSIESKLIDADSLITSFRNSQITETAFKNGLTGKIETINRLYKSSLHQLDVFFVKYTEKLLEEYRQLIAAGLPVDRSTVEQPADQTMLLETPAADDTTSLRDAREETDSAGNEATIGDAGYEVTIQEEPVAEPVDEAGVESPGVTPTVEEEPVVAVMTSAENDSNQELPIETYLDIEPGVSLTEEPGFIDQGIDDRASIPLEQEQPTPMPYEITAQKPEEIPPLEVQPQEMYDSTELPQERAASDEEPYEMSPSAYPAMEDQPVEPLLADETMVDQPAFDYSAESAEASEATEAIEQPLFPQSVPDRKPGYRRDESVEPATIYDIEAETIIADRSEILRSKPPVKEEAHKSSLGITGDDISTQLDNFFNIK